MGSQSIDRSFNSLNHRLRDELNGITVPSSARAADETVLILAEHEQIAELLVEFCSVAGYPATTPRRGEPIEAACRRTRAKLVILDFGLMSEASSFVPGELVEPGARLLLFSGCFLAKMLRSHARDHGVPFFELPIAQQDFTSVLNAIFDT